MNQPTQSQTTPPKPSTDPSDYQTYGAWFRALGMAQAIEDRERALRAMKRLREREAHRAE